MSDTASVKISYDAKITPDTLQQKLHAAWIKIAEQKILDTLIEKCRFGAHQKTPPERGKYGISLLKKPLH